MQQTPWGQMMSFPLTAAEMFSRSLQNWWQPSCPPPYNSWGPPSCPPPVAACDEPRRREASCCGVNCHCDGQDCHDGCACRDRGSHRGSDCVRLVEFTLVVVGLGHHSRVLEHGQRVMEDCVTLEDFQNRIIYEWARHHDEPIDANNLRVYTKVLDSWRKPCFDFEEVQVQTLRQIRDAIETNG